MKKISLISASLALLVIGSVAGYKFASDGNRVTATGPKVQISREVPANESVSFDHFWQVWDLLHSEYYDPTKLVPENLVNGAIKGMVAAVGDPYTIFLDKQQQKVTEQDLSGSFDGIGIEIGYKGTTLAVISPLAGSPAEKAGILPGDLILEIKDAAKNIDKPTDGMSLPEAVQIIRGDKGTKVTLGILREGSDKPLIIDVERQSIDVPSVVLTYEGANKDVARIRISKFGAETKSEWDKAILDFIGKQNVKGIVLDLRNNPGGYLQAAADIATDFFETGTLVVKEESGGVVKEQVKTTERGRLIGEKMIVLVNKGSASASEILSGALRDQKQYKLMGTTSFGKGTVQEPQQFPDGTGIHITIRKWLTPNGTWVHGKGLDPDMKVEDDPKTPADEQLEAAVKYVEQ